MSRKNGTAISKQKNTEGGEMIRLVMSIRNAGIGGFALFFIFCSSVVAAVTIKDTAITWHTNSYSIRADYGLISAQANTSVAKTFNALVIDNEFLKIILVPEFGGRIVSMVYKPTNHQELYTNQCGVPYGINAGNFYYNWLMVYGGIMPTFSEPEHGKFWLRPWHYQIVKQTTDTVSVQMDQKDTVAFGGKPGKFAYGATGIECVFTVSIVTGRNYIDIGVVLTNPSTQSKNFEYWTMTTLAPGSSQSDPRCTAGAELITPIKNVNIPGSYGAIRGQEQNVGGNVFTFNKLRWWKNWPDMGIAYAWPDASTPLNTFWGVINHDDREGIIRVSNNDQTIGLKIWAWSFPLSVNSNSGTNLPYLELWAGVSQQFFSAAQIGAGQQKIWKEYFVPTVKCDSVTHANQEVVCNFKTDKTSYNASTDAGVTITAQMLFTAPNQQDKVSLSFGGSQTVVVLDSNITTDPLGNVITKTVPFSNLCNGLNKVTLKAVSSQNAQLISADIPIVITNGQPCTVLGTISPLRLQHASGFGKAGTARVYSLDGRLVSVLKNEAGAGKLRLGKGVYFLTTENNRSGKMVRFNVQ
jgi:hypothetical protein